MIKIAVCDDKNEAAALTEKINEIFEKDETMIRISYFKNAALLRYEVEDRVYFDLYILVIQQGRTEKEKQLMKTVRGRDSEAFFLVLADKLEPTLAFPIKSVQIIKKNATDDEIENIIEDVKAAMEKRKKQYLKECVDYAKSIVLTEKGNSINNESFSDDYILFVDGSNYQDYPYPYSNVFNKEQFEHWKKNHKKKFKDFDDFMKYVKSNL